MVMKENPVRSVDSREETKEKGKGDNGLKRERTGWREKTVRSRERGLRLEIGMDI